MLRPQQTVASLPPEEGRRDGWWLGLLYVLGSQMVPAGQAIKSVTVMMNGSAFVTLFSQAGRILLPPILLMLVVEFLVGPSKSYRGALFLLPMIIVVEPARVDDRPVQLAAVENVAHRTNEMVCMTFGAVVVGDMRLRVGCCIERTEHDESLCALFDRCNSGFDPPKMIDQNGLVFAGFGA